MDKGFLFTSLVSNEVYPFFQLDSDEEPMSMAVQDTKGEDLETSLAALQERMAENDELVLLADYVIMSFEELHRVEKWIFYFHDFSLSAIFREIILLCNFLS